MTWTAPRGALVELAQIGAPNLTILDRATLTVLLDRADRA